MEIQLHNLIKSLYKEIQDMTPDDGFSSPRDIELVAEVNKKGAVLNELQKAMRIINPLYDYEG